MIAAAHEVIDQCFLSLRKAVKRGAIAILIDERKVGHFLAHLVAGGGAGGKPGESGTRDQDRCDHS